MNIVVDVSVFIDRLFVYSRERSLRAHRVFQAIEEGGYSIFEPQVLGWSLPRSWLGGSLEVWP